MSVIGLWRKKTVTWWEDQATLKEHVFSNQWVIIFFLFQFRVWRVLFVFNSVPIIWCFLDIPGLEDDCFNAKEIAPKNRKSLVPPYPVCQWLLPAGQPTTWSCSCVVYSPFAWEKLPAKKNFKQDLMTTCFPKCIERIFNTESHEPSICMKIARARRDGGPKTKTSTHPM